MSFEYAAETKERERPAERNVFQSAPAGRNCRRPVGGGREEGELPVRENDGSRNLAGMLIAFAAALPPPRRIPFRTKAWRA
jgi:hypothetical protein